MTDQAPGHARIIDAALLPDSLRELVRVLGESAAFRLVQVFGGSAFVVPTRKVNTLLLELLGDAAYQVLVQIYGGDRLELPKYDSVLRQLRHEHVRGLRGAGLTMSEVAVASGYTKRHVINILATDREQDVPLEQRSLFDA